MDRIAEAEREGWLGEVEGLQVSLAGAEDKLAQITASLQRKADAVQLGMPAFPTSPAVLIRPARREGTRDLIAEALRACASGILTAEAGVSLLIDCGGWLHRDDFSGHFITTGTSISDGTTLMATIDWPAAVTALDGVACHAAAANATCSASPPASPTGSGSASRSPDQHRSPERESPGDSHPARKRANMEQPIQNVI